MFYLVKDILKNQMLGLTLFYYLANSPAYIAMLKYRLNDKTSFVAGIRYNLSQVQSAQRNTRMSNIIVHNNM